MAHLLIIHFFTQHARFFLTGKKMKQNKLNQHSILSSKLREIITALEDQSVANPHTKSLIEIWS